MNRALWKPALLILLVLVIATTGGFVIRGHAGSDKNKTAEVAAADDPAPKAVDPPPAGWAPEAVAAPDAGVNPKAAEERRLLLETLGALTAAQSFQTYFNFGLIADGKARGTYTDPDAYKLLDSVLSLLDSVDRKLAALSGIDLDKEDRESLAQMRALSALLRQQGKDLQSFWESGKDEDAARYESGRKDSWAALSKLMGIGR